MRTSQKEVDYFNYVLQEISTNIQNCKEHIKNNTGSPYNVHYSLCSELHRMLFVKYSLGESILTLKEIQDEYFEFFFKKIPLEINRPDFKYSKLKQHIAYYQPFLDILCFGILLKTDESILNKYKLLLDEHYGKDLLIEHIWAANKNEAYTPEPKVKLLYPKSYSLLFEAYLSNKSEREDVVLLYAKSWMKTKKSAPWYGDKKISSVNGAVAYIGYWNLEGAVSAYLFGINASKFQNIEYFPIDLLIHSQE